jgi:hypothetical protein
MTPTTVALTSCVAYTVDVGEGPSVPIKVSGLYDVIGFEERESDQWTLEPHIGRNSGPTRVYVDADSLEEQVRPAAYGARLLAEREVGFMFDRALAEARA